MTIKSSNAWMYLVLPINITLGSIGTLVTFRIISLGGSELDVSHVITLGNLVLIPSSLFWGFISDRYDRKYIILSSFGFSSLFTIILSVSQNLPLIALFYTLVSFFSVGYNTPYNLLIMETTPKVRWAEQFSRLSMMSAIGVLLSTLVSTFATLFTSVSSIILILGLIGILTTIIGVWLIPNSIINIERVAIVHIKDSFLTRLKMLPIFFPHRPNLRFIKIFKLRNLIIKPINFTPLLYIAIFLFYISSGLFNTMYPVALYSKNLEKSEIFGILSLGIGIQILTYTISGKVVNKIKEGHACYISLIVRGISYSSISFAIYTLDTYGIFITSLILYPIAAGIAFAIFNTSSNTLIFKIVGERSHGKGLGEYSTLVGIGMFTGSLLSGYISSSLGFQTDFLIAGLLLFISAYIF
ncbi:MAG: MFS transporter, partial [Sulfolobaceae archaeon]